MESVLTPLPYTHPSAGSYSALLVLEVGKSFAGGFYMMPQARGHGQQWGQQWVPVSSGPCLHAS